MRNISRNETRGTEPSALIGAHNALTARLGELAGFDGIWASGLELSLSLGVLDDGMVEDSVLPHRVAEMTSAVSVPVWVDVDNCGSTPDRAAVRAREIASAGARALIIEDKRTPKLNSFIDGAHDLEPAELVSEKLRAVIGTVSPLACAVYARTESLIAGRPVDEAVERCERYLDAGVSGVVVHSKDNEPITMIDAIRRLPADTHIVAIPTKYYRYTRAELGRVGVRTVIYANHGARASIAAIRDAYASILKNGSSEEIESRIAPLAEVFSLQRPSGSRARSWTTP